MGQRVAGICYIKVDGTQLTVMGDVECPLTPTKKERVAALASVAGYKETVKEPFVKVKAVYTPDFPRAQVAAGTNMTVTAELANGMVYTLAGAWLEGDSDAKGDTGEIDLEFSGTSGVWS